MQEQHMADLPPERLQTSPPFTYVGLDIFGPWSVTARRTRGGQSESKRWAIMFCCLSSRAVHIEVVSSLDTSSCVNALRRFFAIRGPAKQLISDCGTNFIRASKELGMHKEQLNTSVQRYLNQQGCSWEFNPPHASHMGGSWERLIGVARRILDSMLREQFTRLTHDVLCTLMAEVTAIINARPLTSVSNDPEDPFILSPAILLTQKVGVPPPPGDFTKTSSPNNGDKCRLLPTNSGTVGAESICQPCSIGGNGPDHTKTYKKETLCFSEIVSLPATAGPWL